MMFLIRKKSINCAERVHQCEIEEAGLAKRQTAAGYLKTLEEIGLLSSVKMGREQYYINKELVKVLSK